jgi:hypothetical protein
VGYRVKMVPVAGLGVPFVSDPYYTGPGGLRPVTH